jgi:hypothetical protein
VTGKENTLFSIAEASLARPSEAVREVVFPAVQGGEATLRDLVREYKTNGPAYRRTVQTTLRASYTGHYRKGLIELLCVLEFWSTNTAHQPVIEALALIARYARAGNLTYYPAGETAPEHKGTTGDWADLAYRVDGDGRRRTVRMVYEVATFQALREQLRCKEIWVAGAGRWRDPDEDLPKDFEARRSEHYESLRKPLDPAEFIGGLRREATWRDRALNAEDALKAAHAEITTQRTRIGELRDLEAEWTQEAITRITTENTTLKQRVRQLTADNRTLDERLQAARSNNRFADRRIAQLEAELASPQGATLCLTWRPGTPGSLPSCLSSSATGWSLTTTPSPRPWPGSLAARPTAPPRCARTSPGSGSSSASPTARDCSPRASREPPPVPPHSRSTVAPCRLGRPAIPEPRRAAPRRPASRWWTAMPA